MAHGEALAHAGGSPGRRPRWLLVVSSLAAGGTERVVSTLANHWSERGIDVGVLTYAPTGADHYALRASVERTALNLMWDSTSPWHSLVSNVVRTRRLRAELVRMRPDAIVAFGDQTNVRVLLATIGLSVPVIVSERSDPRRQPLAQPWRLLRRVLYPRAGSLVVQTQSVAEWARGVTRHDRVHVIPNPVRPLAPREPAQQTDAARRTVIAIGRFTAEKGFDLLVRAFAASGLAANRWQLVIVGDGPLREQTRTLAATLGVAHAVELPGIQREPESWLRSADLFVLPSRHEGFPNALLEAMSCGLPAIAFDCRSGPGEIVRHGVTGMLVPAEDVGALAGALRNLAARPELRSTLGAAAKRDVDVRFRVDAIADAWERLLGGPLDAGAGGR